MKPDIIRAAMHQNLPFVVRSADGKEFFVPHPDFISMGNDAIGIVIVHTEKGYVMLDVENVTAIEFERAESKAPQK